MIKYRVLFVAIITVCLISGCGKSKANRTNANPADFKERRVPRENAKLKAGGLRAKSNVDLMSNPANPHRPDDTISVAQQKGAAGTARSTQDNKNTPGYTQSILNKGSAN